MSYQVLYRQYRPQRFSEVVGQDYVVKTLVNAITSKRIAHAYLFAGPRGTGKTTIAKLFAKAINCENFNKEACDECKSCEAYNGATHPDIIELDAASNNSVKDVREIIDQVPYAPLLGKYKVYIIDEVHMLTTEAFNALLKTIEEPPAHVVFIFATTDPQKVIPTVLSRCQRYNFSKITTYEIKEKVIEILNKENITFEEEAVSQIARMAEGGMRDALSLLEQCLAYNPKELLLEDVENIFGLTSTSKEVELYKQIHTNQTSDVIATLRKMYQRGMDTKRLAIDLLEIIKDVLIYSDKADKTLLTKLNGEEAKELFDVVSVQGLLKDSETIQNVLAKERQNQTFLTYLELAFVQMANNDSFKVEVKPQPVKQEMKVVEEKTEEIIETKPEIVKEEVEVKQVNKQEEIQMVDVNMDFLLSILLDANRDLKIADSIVYNRLDLYQYEPEKRKYYQLLLGTELFASNKDVMIICGNPNQKNSINTLSINKDLYMFLNSEFGIDKMVYAIDEEDKKELIERYKNTPIANRNKPVYVEKYKIEEEKETSSEDKLKELFGEVLTIEE